MTKQTQLEHKAKKYATKIIRLPFVRMVVLTGSVAAGRATQQSDIDYLIVTKPGRIYLARAIVVLFVKFAGQYRTNKKVAGKICPNWFIASPILYSPLILKPKTLPTGRQVLNLKSVDMSRVGEIKVIAQRSKPTLVERQLSGKFGDLLEQLAKKYQIWRIKKDPRTHAQGSEVRWSDAEIGLHPPKV